jgi:hypothetical protein
LQLCFQAEPLADIELALVDAAHQVADRLDAEAAILKRGDQLEALEMRLAVERDATLDDRLRQDALGLIEANRPARDLRDAREIVDRVLGRRSVVAARVGFHGGCCHGYVQHDD